MPDRAPILVVFGIDGEGEKRAFRFAERDAEPALKVATLLGLTCGVDRGRGGSPRPQRRYGGGIYLPATTAMTVSLQSQSSGGSDDRQSGQRFNSHMRAE